MPNKKNKQPKKKAAAPNGAAAGPADAAGAGPNEPDTYALSLLHPHGPTGPPPDLTF